MNQEKQFEMEIVIVEFPGSHAADVTEQALKKVLPDVGVKRVGHLAESFGRPDVAIVPGGASYGDVLRPGALACGVPITAAIVRFARGRNPVLGIGNGFQVLCELGVLPGALMLNKSGGFIEQSSAVKIIGEKSPILADFQAGTTLSMPVACTHGRYFCDTKSAHELEKDGRIALQYVDADGDPTEECNVTGSVKNIAGVFNRGRTTLGLMCHPERAIDLAFGSADGAALLQSFAKSPTVEISEDE